MAKNSDKSERLVEARARIESARSTNSDELDLSDIGLTHEDLAKLIPEIGSLTALQTLGLNSNQLTTLPPEIGSLTALQKLYLNSNQLTTLPPEIGSLTALQELSLNSNQLTTLPPEIGSLTALQELQLGINQLTSLPPEIGSLVALKELELYLNQLSSLPPEMASLTSLIELNLHTNLLISFPQEIFFFRALQYLNISGNQISSLPAEIGSLTQLKELYLHINRLAALPPEIGSLTALQTLNLDNNQLTTLAPEIGSLAALQTLNLDNNQLTTLPSEIGRLFHLTTLVLEDNNLADLPASMQALSSLEELTLQGNAGLSLPIEVLGPTYLESGPSRPPTKPQTILDYYFRTRMGTRCLHEFKLILIGQGGVGKTALVNRLIRDKFEGTEMTRGIRIESWQVTVGGDKVKAHVWDFGGQDLMHGTHQFFLTQRSLYLLVVAARGSHQDEDAEYWLKTISAFGAESPVIVVLNKSDERPFELNENALRKKYPAIAGFVKTDCYTPRGIDELKQKIREVADTLPGLRGRFPEAWFAIKERLSGMKDNFLTFPQFRAECSKLGEPDSKGQEELAKVLHLLGIALNFRDDERLRDTSVLNPLWVTGGIYALLNDNLLQERHGELTLKDFGRVLSREHYPTSTHPFLLELMGKFELCFPLDGEGQAKRYLIPELLSPQEPDTAAGLDTNDPLAFSYFYPSLLPHGLLPRFIVRLYQLIKDRLRWRTGAILTWFDAEALVKADEEDRCIRIRVRGTARRRLELLGIIRQHFDALHLQFHGLLPREVVQLPEYPAVAVEYSHVEAAARAGLKQMPVFPEGNMVMISPDALLRQFEIEGEERDAGNRGAVENEPTPPHALKRSGRRSRGAGA